jgi:hypothetical protein
MKVTIVGVVLLAACASSTPVNSSGTMDDPGGLGAHLAGDDPHADSPPATTPPPATKLDVDQDGLDDIDEQKWAKEYLPYLSLSPNDACPIGGLVVRVSPHPMGNGFVHIIYDFLYDNDCGLAGHVGDDEVFAITIQTSQPAPQGIVAIKTISHQGTACERDNACGRCPGQTPCQTLPLNGKAWPAVWSAQDKHGSYVNRGADCTWANTCLDTCEDASVATLPPIVNVGEPGHSMVSDLTAQGFITTANGWTNPQLFNFDPWKSQSFGGAGDISQDLVDPAFDTPACP